MIDLARGVARPLTTDSAGVYLAPKLTPGTYTVRAEAKGFQTVEHAKIFLEVGQSVKVDLVLQPGAQTQTITVFRNRRLPLKDKFSHFRARRICFVLLASCSLRLRHLPWSSLRSRPLPANAQRHGNHARRYRACASVFIAGFSEKSKTRAPKFDIEAYTRATANSASHDTSEQDIHGH